MSYCKICGRETNIVCICGFCNECLRNYTHEGCYDRLNCEKSKDGRGEK